MKILAFSDTHGNKSPITQLKKTIKQEQPDILICAGDITIFETEIKKIVKEIASLKVKTFIIHGNHETSSIMKNACKPYKSLIYLHNASYRLDNYIFFGHGGGGFSLIDEEFEKLSKQFKKDIKKGDIVTLLTHAPPHKTKLDKINKEHVGNKSYRKFIEKSKVRLAISGHIHENSETVDQIKDAVVINPGPFGMIIEI